MALHVFVCLLVFFLILFLVWAIFWLNATGSVLQPWR